MSERQHRWVIATTIEVDPAVAARADEHEYVVLTSVRAEVLELYCDHCRRDYDRANGTPCQLGPQHSGGPRRQPDLAPVPPTGTPPPAATGPAELALFD